MFTNTKNGWKVFGLFMMLAALLLAGCSSSASAGNSREINATLTSYKITLDQSTITPGKVTFHIKNAATDMKHEFVVFKTDLDAANLPLDADGNVAEDQLQKVDEKELDPGASADLVIDNLPAGHYAIVCNQPGHYKQGMYINFTVQ